MDLQQRKKNKAAVWKYLSAPEGYSPETVEAALEQFYTEDAVWEIFHPFNTIRGTAEAADTFWKPLFDAVPDLERRTDIFAGDLYKGEYWVTSLGHLCGSFQNPWLGIPPTQKIVYLRIGEFFQVRDAAIVKHHILLDIPDLMRQAGVYPFRVMPGAPGLVPGPKKHDGLRTGDDDPGQKTLDTVLSMHKALHNFDGKDLNSMQHSQCWSEHFNYYAPAGIGTARGMQEFKDYHQQPFLASFPDRNGTEHYARVSDGPIAATTHWGTLTATHTGSVWLGLPATGKKLKMRVADWYCADERGLLHENWLMMDILDICLQMGLDVLGNMHLLS